MRKRKTIWPAGSVWRDGFGETISALQAIKCGEYLHQKHVYLYIKIWEENLVVLKYVKIMGLMIKILSFIYFLLRGISRTTEKNGFLQFKSKSKSFSLYFRSYVYKTKYFFKS